MDRSASAESAEEGVSGGEISTHSKRPKPNPKPGICKRELIVLSREDVAVILRGMIDHTARTGLYAAYDLNDFHDSIKTSLRVHNFPKRKLKTKIRFLRLNYRRGVISKRRDPEIYGLCSQIWGTLEEEEEVEAVDEKQHCFRLAPMKLYLERVRLVQQQIQLLLHLF